MPWFPTEEEKSCSSRSSCSENSSEEEAPSSSSSPQQMVDAMQPFIPKKKLQYMGVRSLRQVQPGMYVEVAVAHLSVKIQNYVSLAQKFMNPELFEALSDFTRTVSELVESCQGSIDSARGDTIVAFFPQAQNAAKAACEITVRANITKLGKHVELGIGLHHFVSILAASKIGANHVSVDFFADTIGLASQLAALKSKTRIVATKAVVDQISPETFSSQSLGKEGSFDKEIFEIDEKE